jgi:hypothetical protein
MKKYTEGTGTETMTTYGRELLAGMLGFTETAPLAETFRPINDALADAGNARRARYAVVIETRAGVRVAEYTVERDIRAFARSLQAAEGDLDGPAHHTLLPAGLNAVILPRRRAQARELRNLITRFQGSVVPAAVTLAAEWLPRLTAAAVRLETALDAFDAATAAYEDAFRLELNARTRHSFAVDELMGRVRALFPRNRAQQDAVFPVVRSSSKSDGEDDPVVTPPAETDPAAPAPMPGPATPLTP